MAFTIETERMALRPVQLTDLPAMHHIFTNELGRKYLSDNQILSEEQVQTFITISKQTFSERQYGLWLLHKKPDNEVIGVAGLWAMFDEKQPELLYAILPEYTGRGFATEAVAEIIRYAFTNLSFAYVDASCDVPNVDSIRVAERLGMIKFKEETINGLPLVFFRQENLPSNDTTA
jgi:[ribosomal protein S5]-alanine N-acetyltransferase